MVKWRVTTSLYPLPAAVRINFSAPMIGRERFTRGFRLVFGLVWAAALLTPREIDAVVPPKLSIGIEPGIEAAFFLRWQCHDSSSFPRRGWLVEFPLKTTGE